MGWHARRIMRTICLLLALLCLGFLCNNFAQTKINLEDFDETAVPPDLSVKERKVDNGVERQGVDSSRRVYYEMTVDQSGKLLNDTSVRKFVYDKKGNYIIMDQDAEGGIVPLKLGASYCWIVPGRQDQFLRKAWIDKEGGVLEEERRAYDDQGRLTQEGLVDPASGSFTQEYRHRYSEDGKSQFTTEFLNGQQVGEESQSTLSGE